VKFCLIILEYFTFRLVFLVKIAQAPNYSCVLETQMKKIIDINSNKRSFFLPLQILAASAVIASCAPVETKVEQTDLFFPPPPDPARYVFERTVTGSASLLIEDDESKMRRMLTGEGMSTLGFSKPFDVTACKGTMYVSDTVQRSVFAFNAVHKDFFMVGDREPGLLAKPLGLAVDGQCRLYAVDATRGAIVIYEADGTYVASIGGSMYFDRLSHLAVNPEGTRVFAVDTGGVNSEHHYIRVFDVQTGEHLYDIGTRGSEPGQFNLPRDIALGSDGNLYVVDGGNFRIQVFSQDGQYLRHFGTTGRQLGQFARPKGIAVDADDNVFVSDASHGNFQIFDRDDALLLFVGNRSEQNDRAAYMLPAGLHVDEDGRVYMVDQFFRKVDIYRPAGLDINQIPAIDYDFLTRAVNS